jgi:peptidoglycan L-alanyl-D-glutamate endopeptidase CwlK
MGYTFGERSRRHLSQVHPDMVKIAERAISVSQVDFGVIEGHRTQARQQSLFEQGLSKLDGVTKKSKHQSLPSEAIDIYIYVPGRKDLAWDFNHLSYVAGVFNAVAELLYDSGQISHLIRWGGNWDRDRIIIADQEFDDLVHMELYQP